MKNFIQQGDTLDVVASANVTSGQFVIIGNLSGVATTTAAAGMTFALKTTGVFELPKLTTEAWTVGAKVYWDATNLWATIVAGSNALIGRVSEPNANPSAVGRVLLAVRGVIDFDSLVISPLMGVFGQPFVITPVVSMPGTPAYTATGVWSSPTREIALENGGVLSTNEFHLGIRVADLTVLPQQEDQIAIGAASYIIGDVLLDGQGGADLILRQVPQ